MSNKKIFASAQDVEAAFIDALERGDLEAMMAVWSEDDEIVCVHPGGARLIGYAAIRDAWRRIFDTGRRLQIEMSPPTLVATPFVVTSSRIEFVRLRDQAERSAPLAVTNVFIRGALGWRLIAHHASTVPPESLGELPPKILH
jgi:ketosteroid isomerase-like protein